jgi:hypothetical protein
MTVEQIDIAWKIAAVLFGAGAFWQELKAIRKDISRLEEKVEKHNSFDRRIVRLESIIEEKELQK